MTLYQTVGTVTGPPQMEHVPMIVSFIFVLCSLNSAGRTLLRLLVLLISLLRLPHSQHFNAAHLGWMVSGGLQVRDTLRVCFPRRR
jgi:hypothetical protein